jgi:hypothetical protein
VKADLLRDMSGLPAGGIVAPVLWQIQVAVDQPVAQGGDVGEEDADLAVVDAASGPTILRLDASRVGAAFGKGAFIEDQQGKERIGCSRRGCRRQQGLDQGRA